MIFFKVSLNTLYLLPANRHTEGRLSFCNCFLFSYSAITSTKKENNDFEGTML